MRINIKSPLALLGLVALATSAFAAPITISTGPAPWLVNGNPVVAETNIPGVWINNFGDGVWVGTTVGDAATGAAPGSYTFTLNIFARTGGVGPGSFSLQYAADNAVTWSISNGTLAGTTSCTAGTPNSDCFQAAGGAPRSLTGTYGAGSILTATVVNGGSSLNPMGLLVVGTANLDPSGVPEPSTYAMFTLGGSALALARLRRK